MGMIAQSGCPRPQIKFLRLLYQAYCHRPDIGSPLLSRTTVSSWRFYLDKIIMGISSVIVCILPTKITIKVMELRFA
jgi:hypothetical protein